MDLVAHLSLTAVFAVLITGVSTVGNTAVFIVFFRRKHIHTQSNYFFVCLTFGNLIVGLCYPFQCLVDLGVVTQRAVCFPMLYILLATAFVVIWSLLALTIERYLTITRPFTARNIISEKRAVQIIALILIFAVICGVAVPVLLSLRAPSAPGGEGEGTTFCNFSELMPFTVYRVFVTANRLVSTAAFLVIYTRIFFVVRKHMRAIAQQARQPAPENMPEGSSGRDDSGQWKRKAKSTILLFTIVLYHTLSSIPQSVASSSQEVPTERKIVYTLIHFVTYSSAAVNPLVYGLCNREFRGAFFSLFRRERERVQNGPAVLPPRS